jgi:DNA-directed RNA polymerase subunit K/omega
MLRTEEAEMTEEMDREPTAEKKGPELRTPVNKYELVMAAAKEAERLNTLYNQRHEKPPKKVTLLGLERVRKGLSKITYEEAEPEEPTDELSFFPSDL